jgi:hypothetical protein
MLHRSLEGCGFRAKMAAKDAQMELLHEVQQFRTDASRDKRTALFAGRSRKAAVQRA